MENNEKNNKLLIVLIIIPTIIILGLVIYIINNNLINKANSSSITENNKTLTIYRKMLTKDYYLYYIENYDSYKPDDLNEYRKYNLTCRSSDCEYYQIENFNNILNDFILIKENNNIVLYNLVTNEVVYENNEIEYVTFIQENALLIKTKQGKYGVYDIESQNMTIPTNYEEIKYFSIINEVTRKPNIENILGTGIILYQDGKEGVIDYKTGETILDFKYVDLMCYTNKRTEYSSETKEYKTIVNKNQYCTYKDESKLNILSYDEDTKKIFDLNYQVDKIYYISDNYGYILNDNKIKLIDLSDLSVIQDFSNPTEYKYHEGYNNYETSTFNIIFDKNDKNLKPEDKRCHEYYYNFTTKEGGERDINCGV